MEKVFFSAEDIEISEGKARFGATYYPISSIGAVSVETKSTDTRGASFVLIILGLFAAYSLSNWWLLMVAVGGVGLFARPEREFSLSLATSSGNKQAFKTKDAELFENVRMALEEAISNKS